MSSASGVNFHASLDKMHELERYLVMVGEVLDRVKGVTTTPDQVQANVAMVNMNANALMLVREAIALATGDPYQPTDK
jgi:hypothetical protein